jgi:GGDEF domain-containing protein
VRLGGDEFLALMPMRASDPLQLEKIANRMLVATRRNKELKTTISIGLQFITTEAITKILNSKDVKRAWDTYLDIVDEKIRIAKKRGKTKQYR